MKRFIPLISDVIVVTLCVFFVAFTFVRYYLGNTYAIISATAVALACGTLAFLYIGRKQKKARDVTECRVCAEKLAAHLALLAPEDAAALFARCLDGAEYKDNVIETKDGVYFCRFAPEPADRNDIIEAARLQTKKQKYFVCCTATEECARFAEGTDVEIVNADDIYSMLKERDALPEKYLMDRAQKSGMFSKIKAGFSRRLCRPAFWSGVAMLFFSYFTFYPVYYIAAGAALLLLCAAAAIFGKRAK